jgi:hypothetical protein
MIEAKLRKSSESDARSTHCPQWYSKVPDVPEREVVFSNQPRHQPPRTSCLQSNLHHSATQHRRHTQMDPHTRRNPHNPKIIDRRRKPCWNNSPGPSSFLLRRGWGTRRGSLLKRRVCHLGCCIRCGPLNLEVVARLAGPITCEVP